MTKLEILLGIGGIFVYPVKRWFSDEITKYILKPIFGPIGKRLKIGFIKWFLQTEKDWALFLHGINRYLNKDHKHK